MKHFFKIAVAVFVALSVFPSLHSCKKGKDGPEIRDIRFLYKRDSSFLQGDYLRFSFELRDEVDIKSYLVSIVPAGHTDNPLSYITQHRDLEAGNGLTIEDSLWISEIAEAGDYYFQLGATNVNGYSSDMKLSFKVDEQADNPIHISISNPPAADSTYTNGDTLRVRYIVTDDSSTLQNITVYLSPASGLRDGYENAICMFNSGLLNNVSSDTVIASIVVGSADDNNIPPHPVSSWNIEQGYIVARAYNTAGNIKYSNHLSLTTHDTLP